MYQNVVFMSRIFIRDILTDFMKEHKINNKIREVFPDDEYNKYIKH